MVQGTTILLLRGVQIGTLYKLLGNIIIDGCNDFFVLEGSNEEYRTTTVPIEKIML
jgi:hypothetical protein